MTDETTLTSGAVFEWLRSHAGWLEANGYASEAPLARAAAALIAGPSSIEAFGRDWSATLPAVQRLACRYGIDNATGREFAECAALLFDGRAGTLTLRVDQVDADSEPTSNRGLAWKDREPVTPWTKDHPDVASRRILVAPLAEVQGVVAVHRLRAALRPGNLLALLMDRVEAGFSIEGGEGRMTADAVEAWDEFTRQARVCVRRLGSISAAEWIGPVARNKRAEKIEALGLRATGGPENVEAVSRLFIARAHFTGMMIDETEIREHIRSLADELQERAWKTHGKGKAMH